MKIALLFAVFFSSVLFSLPSYSVPQPPKVPDPFCAPDEFFKYLKSRNHDRVLYVVQKCSNIDLRDKGPNGELFVSLLADTNWDDIFELTLKRTDVDYQSSLNALITKNKFSWLLKLEELKPLQYTLKERDLLVLAYSGSKELLVYLIQNKKLDPNVPNQYGRNIIEESLAALKFDLTELLRSMLAVDQTQFFPTLCIYIDGNGDEQRQAQYLAYFKALLERETVDVNLTCKDGYVLAYHVLSKNADAMLIDRILKDPKLDLSKPTVSYQMVVKLDATYRTWREQYFVAIFDNPTFNLKDKSKEGRNFWHFLAGVYNTSQSEKLVEYLKKIPNEMMLEKDGQGLSPLFYYVNRDQQGITDPVSQLVLGNPLLNPNQVDKDLHILVRAAIKNKHAFFRFLKSIGSKAEKPGSIGPVNSELLQSFVFQEEYFNEFFKLQDLDINGKIRTLNNSNLFSYVLNNSILHQETVIQSLLNDSRFDKTSVNAFSSSREYCNATTTWLRSKNKTEKVALQLAQNSSDTNLSKICYYASYSTLSMASGVGYLALVKYLYGERKLPIQTKDSSSAFERAYQAKQWNVVEYFISQGYKAEFNHEYGEALYRDNQTELLKQFVKDPSFDPNPNPDSNFDLLLSVARDNKKEIFDLIISNPKTKIGSRLPNLIAFYDIDEPENQYFVDKALSKFRIETTLDKVAAIESIVAFSNREWPVDYFKKVAALKNFDINMPVDNWGSGDSSKKMTLFTWLMSEFDPSYLDYIWTIKAFDPSTPSDRSIARAIVKAGLSKNSELFKKHFNLYYSHPKVKPVLPLIGETPILNFLLSCGGYGYECHKLWTATIFLAHPRFKFTQDEMKQFAEILEGDRSYSDNSETVVPFLMAFYGNLAAKPIKQWSHLLFELNWRDINADSTAFQLLRKFEKELDLNVKRANGDTLLSAAANERAEALFEFLIAKPNIDIKGIFSEAWDRQMHNSQRYQWLERLIAVKGKEIPQAEILERFALINDGEREARLPPELLKTMKLAYPLVKSFDQLTSLASDARVAPLYIYIKHFSEDPLVETIYYRILKEDTTLPKNSEKIILYLFKVSRFDLLDIYVSRGYDFTVAIESQNILLKVTELRKLEALQYLAAKGVSALTRCHNNFWSCERGDTAFGTALKMEWYEGADQLLTMKSDLTKQDYSGGHTLLTAVKDNRFSTVEYLINRKIDINYSSVLTTAISQQADQIVWSLLKHQSVDPNKLGYDSTMNNRQTFPIIEAARFGRTDYVKALLAFPKIEKNAKDSLGYRAIDWAATNGYEEIVQLLKN